MLVFFFPFFDNLGSYVYDSMRARTANCFWKGISTAIFSLSCTACARVLSQVDALARARGGPPETAAPALSATRRQRRKVDKCRVAVKKQTNQQTNKPTNTQIYIFSNIYIYIYIYIYSDSYYCHSCSRRWTVRGLNNSL